MLDPLQFYCWVLCNGMKTRFRMVMIAHPGPGIGFHKRFMWRIIIPPTPLWIHLIARLWCSCNRSLSFCPSDESEPFTVYQLKTTFLVASVKLYHKSRA